MRSPRSNLLAAPFLRRATPLGAARAQIAVAIESFLRDASTHHDFDAPLAEFAEHVASHVDADEDLSQRIEDLHGPDLFLAFAALRGVEAAIAELEARVRREVAAVMRGRSFAGVDASDIGQRIMTLLLVGGPDGASKLQQYAGRAPLGAWLRVVAVRLAGRAERKGKREPPTDENTVARLATPQSDPELAYLEHTYRAAFKEAFQAAFFGLSLHDRLLLRQHIFDGLGIDQLGRLHRIHRATAARWLARAREKLVRETEKRLRAKLDISKAELGEVTALIRSHLDVSLSRLLEQQQPI